MPAFMLFFCPVMTRCSSLCSGSRDRQAAKLSTVPGASFIRSNGAVVSRAQAPVYLPKSIDYRPHYEAHPLE